MPCNTLGMTQTIEPVNLDIPPIPQLPPAWRARLPWIIASLLLLGLLSSLLMRMPRTAPAPVQPPAAYWINPVIETKASPGAVGRGATVWRDQSGAVVAVMDAVTPLAGEDVWCELTVNGIMVRDEQVGGQPAVCVWVRDAA